MDDLACEGEVVHQTLRELDFINLWLGGNAVTLRGLHRLLSKGTAADISVADMGCGSGDMLRRLSRWGQARGYQFKLCGVDANPNIVAFARQHSDQFPQIRYQTANVLDPDFGQQQFDVIIATLFVHHFPQPTLVALLQQWKKQARLGIVINDLHRHMLAYHSIRWLTRLFSRSRMVQFDAPLSVRRGFLQSELKQALQDAGIEKYELRWRWAFRWELVIWTAS